MGLPYLIYGKQQQTATGDLPDTGRSEYDRLMRRIALKQQQKNTVSQAIQQLEERLKQQRSGEKLHKTSQQLAALTGEAAGAVKNMQREKDSLLQELSGITLELESAPESVKKRMQLFERRRQLEQQLQDKENTFLLNNATDKKSLVLDCSRQRWIWSSHPGEKRVLGNSADPTAESALAELLALLDKCDGPHSRLIVAVRPDAGGFVQALLEVLKIRYPELEISAEPLISESAGGIGL